MNLSLIFTNKSFQFARQMRLLHFVIMRTLVIAFFHHSTLYAQTEDNERAIKRADIIESVAFGRTFVWGTEGIDPDRHANGWSDSVIIRLINPNPLPEGASFYGGMIADSLTKTFKGIGQIRFTPLKEQIGQYFLFDFEMLSQHNVRNPFTLRIDVLPKPKIDDYKTVAIGHTLRFVWDQTVPVLNRLDLFGWKDTICIKLIEPVPRNTKFINKVIPDATKRNEVHTGQITFTPSKDQLNDEIVFNFEATGQYGRKKWYTLKVNVIDEQKIDQTKTVSIGETLKFGIRRIIPAYEISDWPQSVDVRVIEPIPEAARFSKTMLPDNSTQTVDARGEIIFSPLPEHVNKDLLFTFEFISQRETYWHTVKVNVVPQR